MQNKAFSKILILIIFAFLVGGAVFLIFNTLDYKTVDMGTPEKKSDTECQKYTENECPEGCIVCPPCEACSSLGCRSAEYCKSIGFDENWYEMVKLQRETADWQTYRNEEYGFEIKYPKDFITLETEGLVIVSFCGGEAAAFCGIKGASYHPEICLFKFKKDGPKKNVYEFAFGNSQFLDSDFWPFGKDPKTTNCDVTSIDVGGASGKLWASDYGTGYGEIHAFWESLQDNSFYIMDVATSNDFPSVKTVFSQMLSTFRFID